DIKRNCTEIIRRCRWGNGPTEQAAALVARLAQLRSSLKLMVSNRSRAQGLLQASLRDDHGPLCRNRRVVGILERLRCGCEWQDCSGRQSAERAGCVDQLVRIAGA